MATAKEVRGVPQANNHVRYELHRLLCVNPELPWSRISACFTHRTPQRCHCMAQLKTMSFRIPRRLPIVRKHGHWQSWAMAHLRLQGIASQCSVQSRTAPATHDIIVSANVE